MIIVVAVETICVILMSCMYGFRRGHATATAGVRFDERTHERVFGILFAVAMLCHVIGIFAG